MNFNNCSSSGIKIKLSKTYCIKIGLAGDKKAKNTAKIEVLKKTKLYGEYNSLLF